MECSCAGRRQDVRAIKDDIAGWTPHCGIGKLDSQVVTVIGGDECRPGPDLLGVCEVENRFVIDRLIDLVNATRRG